MPHLLVEEVHTPLEGVDHSLLVGVVHTLVEGVVVVGLQPSLLVLLQPVAWPISFGRKTRSKCSQQKPKELRFQRQSQPQHHWRCHLKLLLENNNTKIIVLKLKKKNDTFSNVCYYTVNALHMVSNVFHGAKCNLGEVKLKTMLVSGLLH